MKPTTKIAMALACVVTVILIFANRPVDPFAADPDRIGFLLASNHVSLVVPFGYEVSIDVGLSVNAPNSELWTESLKTIVYGFEPNPFSYASIVSGTSAKTYPQFKKHLKPEKLFDTVFPIHVAIDETEFDGVVFHCSRDDPGTSSLHASGFANRRDVMVPTIRLDSFMARLPWNQIGHVLHLKVDAQGNDLRILKSAGVYLKRVACVTPEMDVSGYDGGHTRGEIESFLFSQNFQPLKGDTWINSAFTSLAHKCIVEGL